MFHSDFKAEVLWLGIYEGRLSYDDGRLLSTQMAKLDDFSRSIKSIETRHINIHQCQPIGGSTNTAWILQSLDDLLHPFQSIIGAVGEKIEGFQEHLHCHDVRVLIINDDGLNTWALGGNRFIGGRTVDWSRQVRNRDVWNIREVWFWGFITEFLEAKLIGTDWGSLLLDEVETNLLGKGDYTRFLHFWMLALSMTTAAIGWYFRLVSMHEDESTLLLWLMRWLCVVIDAKSIAIHTSYGRMTLLGWWVLIDLVEDVEPEWWALAYLRYKLDASPLNAFEFWQLESQLITDHEPKAKVLMAIIGKTHIGPLIVEQLVESQLIDIVHSAPFIFNGDPHQVVLLE